MNDFWRSEFGCHSECFTMKIKTLFQELLSPLSNPRTALKLPIGFVIVTSTTVYTMGFVIVTSTTVYNNKFRIICSLTLLHLFLYGGGKQETTARTLVVRLCLKAPTDVDARDDIFPRRAHGGRSSVPGYAVVLRVC